MLAVEVYLNRFPTDASVPISQEIGRFESCSSQAIKKIAPQWVLSFLLAEREGFEPSVHCCTPDFESGPL